MLAGLDLRGCRALDGMCGGGQNTAYLLERGVRVDGVDISDTQCQIYAQRFPHCPVYCASMLDTGLPTASYDLVIVESLHHLPPQVDAGVAEIVRLLKPGGHLLLWEPAAGSILNLARKIWYRLDSIYFQPNEAAIDIKHILRNPELNLLHRRYGGNFAYFFVFSSLHLRIQPRAVVRYSDLAMSVERLINRVQGRYLASWVLALLQKRAS